VYQYTIRRSRAGAREEHVIQRILSTRFVVVNGMASCDVFLVMCVWLYVADDEGGVGSSSGGGTAGGHGVRGGGVDGFGAGSGGVCHVDDITWGTGGERKFSESIESLAGAYTRPLLSST